MDFTVEKGFRYTPQEVLHGCDELVANLNRASDFAHKYQGITYLRAMHDAYVQYGIEGMRVQAMYAVGNLSGWRGVDGRVARGWLRELGKKGTIVVKI